LARDARMAAAAAERARVYLEELVEKRKETLPEILKESEADDGFFLCPFLFATRPRGCVCSMAYARGDAGPLHAIAAAPRRRRRYITQASTASAPRASRTRSECI
jgi:hypothetical protein